MTLKHKIIPTGERVLIKPFTEEELRKGDKKSKLNFVLPESMVKEKSAQGKVLAIGHTVTSVKTGDKVIFSKYSYDEIDVDGEELYLIKEENILAVIK